MGRTKSDSPLKFPWDKIFSEDERQLDNAIEYCKSNSSGSENLKRAVTAIGYGYNSGSKSVLCERIKEKAKQIRFQLDKVEDDADRELLREQVINFYRQTYLKKFEGKEEGIDRIAIPERPELPFLDEREKTMFNVSSPPSSPRGGSKEVKKTIIIEEEEELSNEEKILRAEVILYFKNAPVINGKRSINGKDLYDSLSNKYTHPSILNKDNVKRQIRDVSNVFNKLTKSQIQESEKIVSKGKKEEKKKPVIIEEEEEYEIKRPYPPRVISVPPIKLPPSPKGLSELEVLNFIRKKGWPEPLIKSKESLCDYVLRKIREEDEKSEGDYHSLRDDIERLSNNLIALTEMYEIRLNEIEKIQKKQKKKKSVTWGKDEIREFESQKEEIKEKIEETKAQLEDAKEREKEVVEEKRQMCFRMRDWLDSDDFDRVEVEKDLLCDNGNVCNVENGVCESGMTSMDEYAELGISKIKGKKETVDRLNKKFNKKKVMIVEEEEIIPREPVTPEPLKKVMIIEEDEEEPGSERELPTIKEIKPIVKQIILRNKDNLENIKIKDIMSELNSHFKIDLSEMKNEIKPIAKKEVIKMIALIEKEKVAIEEPILREEPIAIEEPIVIEEPIEMVDEIKVPIVKECNKISFDEDVSDEVRAKDLMCDEGEVCDLDTSRCIPEIEAMEPVEELTIGGVLLKVTGKNKIVQALKEKIARAGGEIVVPVVEEEPVVPREPIVEVPREPLEEKKEEVVEVASREPRGKSLSELVEESKANDVFASNIPGKRPTLQEIVKGIQSITREVPVITAQTKIRVAEKKCIDRIAMCAGIKLM